MRRFHLKIVLALVLLWMLPSTVGAQELTPPPPPPDLETEVPPPPPTDKPVEEETADAVEGIPEPPPPEKVAEPDTVESETVEGEAPSPPRKIRRLLRIGAFSLTLSATLATTTFIALGMDVALFGQEFHDQARTFSLLNALIGTTAATTMIWPIGLALDGNGSFWVTSLTSLSAGLLGIGWMYAYSQGDPDKLLNHSFLPGFFAFVSGMVAYELTSDTSRRYREATGEGDRKWTVGATVAPTDGGAQVGLAGRW